MAERTGLSPATVHRIWSASGLQPQRGETFPLSSDPQFVPTVRDIVGLYMDPPNRALVLRVDEKRICSEHGEPQPTPYTERQPRLHDAIRPPTTMLLAGLDAATAKVPGACSRKGRTTEFRSFLRRIDDVVPDDQEIHLILENCAWQQTPIILRWLVRHPHFHLHFAPTHSAWLNELERWFELLPRADSRLGDAGNSAALERAIKAFTEARGEDPRAFSWTAPADEVAEVGAVERMLLEGSGRAVDRRRLRPDDLHRGEEQRS